MTSTKPIVASLALVVVLCGYVSAKCDLMKDFKKEFEEIKKWGEDQCKKAGGKDLSDDDMKKAKTCYDQHLAPAMSSDNGKKVHKFCGDKVFVDKTKSVCHNKDTQKAIQSDAMKDIGVQTGMKLKQEIESKDDCQPFKGHFQGFCGCIKS